MTGAVNEAHGANELGFTAAIRALGLSRVIAWGRAFWAFVDECVCVPDLNRDSSSQFFRMPSGPNAGQSLHKSALAVVNVPKRADVNLWLNNEFIALLL
jgi:hypothetical protein